MTSSDVLIIGGGPAGSTAASCLSMKGHRVTVFEKEKFPRDHVGESLLPFCYELFCELGVLGEMERRFVRKPGVRFISPDGTFTTTWCFDRVIKDETYLSFHVLRSEFDTILLENARRHGATVFEETRVTDLDLNVDDGSGRSSVRLETTDAAGRKEAHRARFVIDASGRSTFMGHRLRARSLDENLKRTALWSHFDGVEMTGGLEEGLSVIVYLGGDAKGWSWGFPL